MKNIVVIGGGTGLSTMLRGIKNMDANITAIVAVTDDGGGSGVLRDELGILPPGDIRNCIWALSEAEPVMRKLINYRFEDGSLKGQSFGNIFLAAMNQISDGFSDATEKMAKVLNVKGSVLPVTEDITQLIALFGDKNKIVGESAISNYGLEKETPISDICFTSKCTILPKAEKAILDADLIILGPGSLYTSIIPNLLVSGCTDAIKNSKGKTLYICNVMTQEGETDNFTAYDHVKAIEKHSYDGIIETILVNNKIPNDEILKEYEKEKSSTVKIDEDKLKHLNINIVKADLLNEDGFLARHNYKKLAKEIEKFI